jgi:hypothetical protein
MQLMNKSLTRHSGLKGGVFGNLIFGGYDASRFTQNGVVFNMNSNTSRDLLVGLRSITSADSTGKKTTLMKDAIMTLIDSSVPHIWLPVSACKAFEDTFGLIHDNATDLYLVNNALHSSLLQQNPNITFTLGDQTTGGPTVDIVLPYAAFDLQVSSPIVNNPQTYFPLRRAVNDTQYTLGRTFLQEAYVVTDYSTHTFNVSQCVFEEGSKQDIVAISPDMPKPTSSFQPQSTSSSQPNSTSVSQPKLENGASSQHHLSVGDIVGIAVGGAAVLALLIFALFLLCRRRRNFYRISQASLEAPVLNPDGWRAPGTPIYDEFATRPLADEPFGTNAAGLSRPVPGTELSSMTTHDRSSGGRPSSPNTRIRDGGG